MKHSAAKGRPIIDLTDEHDVCGLVMLALLAIVVIELIWGPL